MLMCVFVGWQDVKANWAKPDAQGTFGRVFFGSQGLLGMGGQVVPPPSPIRCLNNRKRKNQKPETQTGSQTPASRNTDDAGALVQVGGEWEGGDK